MASIALENPQRRERRHIYVVMDAFGITPKLDACEGGRVKQRKRRYLY
jgi:hypothetical protein